MAVKESKKRIKRKNGKRLSARRRRRARVLFGLAFSCVIIIIAAVFITMLRYVQKLPEDKIYNNIFVGNVDVSGMTNKEAKSALKSSIKKDQAITISMKVKDNVLNATLEELGITYKDIDKSIKEAFDYGKHGSLWRKYRTAKSLEKEQLVLDKVHAVSKKKMGIVITERSEEFINHAVNATIAKGVDGFKITKEKEGETVDINKTVKVLTTHLNDSWDHKDFSVKLPMKAEKPMVKKEDLKSITDELSSFSTDAGGGERWKNLKTGVDMINGSILMPGQEFSVHDETAPYDAEHGYVEAGSYENGQVVDSFGGGICQVSTTLYNAVLYAELEIVERYPHSMLVNYVDPSRDAAIAGDFLDLKFKNNYDTPIYIAAEIDTVNQMHFTIYGKETRPEGRTVEFESETLSTEDYGIKYKEDPEAPFGSINKEGSPHTGKTAQLWKVVYLDGVEQSRDVINNSTYEKSDVIAKVGTKSENAQAVTALQQAIASQSESQIQSAIAQAGGGQ